MASMMQTRPNRGRAVLRLRYGSELWRQYLAQTPPGPLDRHLAVALRQYPQFGSRDRRAYREREYGSLERDRAFLEKASPITYLDQIRAPLFVIHGANDPRVPLSEAEQIKAALDDKGVPCELRVYHDEGHGLAKRANKLDAYPAALAFLREHLAR